MFPQNHFDGILMRAYLEHEYQPAEVLERAWRVLKPAGCLIIKVPNYGCWNRRVRGKKWCGYRFPDHVNYFTPDSLRQMVEEACFKVTKFGLLDRLPTNDNMWMVVRKSSRLARQLRRAA